MIKSVFKYLLFVCVLIATQVSFAQDKTDPEDPYSDYSYLWEDTKAKEKAEKKRLKEEQKRKKAEAKANKNSVTTPDQNQEITEPSDEAETVLDQPIPPTDTTKVTTTPVDSIQQKEQIIEEETSPVVEETEPEEEVIKDPKERKQINPIKNDFRTGMSEASSDGDGSIDGGFTLTQIGDQYYAGMTISPEFKIWKLRVGMNIPILYGLDDKEFRTEIFKSGVGVLRLIRYLGYGTQKEDPVYVKVGELNNVMLGYGGLLNNYTNSTTYEKRKVGLHYDINYRNIFGIEGLYSDFDASSQNLLGIRPYVRPLISTDIPIIRTLEFGYQIISDKDQTSDQANNFAKTGVMKGSGFDMGMRLLSVPFINIDLFATYSKLNTDKAFTSLKLDKPSSKATGTSIGLNFRMKFIEDVFSTDIRIESLSYTDGYIPQFFNTTYELNKDARISALKDAKKKQGIYGSLQGHVLKKVRLGGSLLIPNEVSDSSKAFVQVNADLDRLADKFSLHGSYIKGDLTDLGDAFELDERSLVKLRFIYHMNKFLAAGLDYYWAFTQVSDGTENGTAFKATRYVMPYFGVSIKF